MCEFCENDVNVGNKKNMETTVQNIKGFISLKIILYLMKSSQINLLITLKKI